MKSKITIGVSGAPGVGKTTVVQEVATMAAPSCGVVVSQDPARVLAKQGVRINKSSRTNDHLALMTVRLRDMLHLHSDLVIFDRSLIDVLVFMELSGYAQGWLLRLVEELIEWQMEILSLYFYIPIEFKAESDGVRIDDPTVNCQIDEITVNQLTRFRPDFITLTGSVTERVDCVLAHLKRIGLASVGY